MKTDTEALMMCIVNQVLIGRYLVSWQIYSLRVKLHLFVTVCVCVPAAGSVQ